MLYIRHFSSLFPTESGNKEIETSLFFEGTHSAKIDQKILANYKIPYVEIETSLIGELLRINKEIFQPINNNEKQLYPLKLNTALDSRYIRLDGVLIIPSCTNLSTPITYLFKVNPGTLKIDINYININGKNLIELIGLNTEGSFIDKVKEKKFLEHMIKIENKFQESDIVKNICQKNINP